MFNDEDDPNTEKAKAIQDDFKRELKDLLYKYSVEIEAHDHWTGYAECGQDIRISAEFDAWQINEIDFGDRIDDKI